MPPLSITVIVPFAINANVMNFCPSSTYFTR